MVEYKIERVKMIYLNDSYVKEFHAPIVVVEEEKIITADSCFYAQSGGQPGDKGVVEVNGQTVNVINTIKHEKGIAHVLENVIEGASGDIQGIIDWDHRFRLMRMHTTMHLLCAALPYYVTGGSIGLEKSRIDFDLGEETFEFETLNKLSMILFNKPIRFHISGLPAKSLINNLNSFAPFLFSPSNQWSNSIG